MKSKKFIRANPHLPVRNLQQTLDYYRDNLGFYEEWTWTNDEGTVIDGGIRRDDMRLLFAEDPEFVNVINSYRKSRLPLMWFVDNIDEIFSEFQKREIEFADTLKVHAYGLKEFAFVDINGYYIRVAERAAEVEEV
jgi:uncharacterized glyoxalase superfamily protein PhnB